MCLQELIGRNPGLFKQAHQGADFQFSVIGHDAAYRTMPHNDVAAALTRDNETQRSKARTASAPETTGKLGMGRNLERGQQGATAEGKRKLIQIKLGGLSQIVQRFLDGFALRGCVGLWIEGYVTAFRGRSQDS